MDPVADNPYQLLGIPETATPQEIRAAYRRAALEHHPDRSAGSTETFAKISHAYEVLTDPDQARDFRQRAQRQQQQEYHPSSSSAGYSYHDPFAVFESVFRDEFGPDFFGGRHSSSSSNRMDSFFRNDPFFSDPFFASPFGSMMGRRGDLVGGHRSSFFHDPFDSLLDKLQAQASHGNNNNNGQHFYSSTTTVSSRRTSGGEWVTETHRNHNGDTVHETVHRRPDGTVLERTVEGNEDLLRNHKAVEAGSEDAATVQHKNTSGGGLFRRLPWGQRGGDSGGGDEATA